MLAQFLFFLLAVVAITAALGMLIARNPVSSALWLILNLLSVAGLYLTLHAQFIAVIQVLVYAGAIMVLFLFVIMLLNLAELPRVQAFDWKLVTGFLLAVVILAQLVYVVARSLDVLPMALGPPGPDQPGSAYQLARELFTRYAMPFEVIGLMLLIATIGALMLARRRVV